MRKDIYEDSLSQEMPPFKADLAASLAKELLEKGTKYAKIALIFLGSCSANPLRAVVRNHLYLNR